MEVCECAHNACIGNKKPCFEGAVLSYLVECVDPIIYSANDSVNVLFRWRLVSRNQLTSDGGYFPETNSL